MRVFADVSKETLPKKKHMSQYRIISICQRTINVINCAQEAASLISKTGPVKKKKANLFQHQGHRNKMDSEYIESYISIYAHVSDLDLGVVL